MNIFNGEPSIKLDHRPFYSITIPCYNSRNKLPRLLNSILDQDMNDDIEVILCDDHSIEPYQDIVEEYNKQISIKQVRTDYNCCPGNTRERAAQYAEGIWLTNCDHDDALLPNALKTVKQCIEEYDEHYAVYTNYLEIELHKDGSESFIKRNKKEMLLTHGKFFNMDNLWKKYDIHYKKDLITHEDIYISKLINLILSETVHHMPLKLDLDTYKFYQHKSSINSTKYRNIFYNGQEHPFIEVKYKDFCEAHYGIYPLCYDKGYITKQDMIEYMLSIIIYDYMFMQAFIYNNPNTYIEENEKLSINHLKFIKQISGMDTEKIYKTIRHTTAYRDIEKAVRFLFKNFECKYTLKDWMNYIDR